MYNLAKFVIRISLCQNDITEYSINNFVYLGISNQKNDSNYVFLFHKDTYYYTNKNDFYHNFDEYIAPIKHMLDGNTKIVIVLDNDSVYFVFNNVLISILRFNNETFIRAIKSNELIDQQNIKPQNIKTIQRSLFTDIIGEIESPTAPDHISVVYHIRNAISFVSNNTALERICYINIGRYPIDIKMLNLTISELLYKCCPW